jgi:hypothetical protein
MEPIDVHEVAYSLNQFKPVEYALEPPEMAIWDTAFRSGRYIHWFLKGRQLVSTDCSGLF